MSDSSALQLPHTAEAIAFAKAVASRWGLEATGDEAMQCVVCGGMAEAPAARLRSALPVGEAAVECAVSDVIVAWAARNRASGHGLPFPPDVVGVAAPALADLRGAHRSGCPHAALPPLFGCPAWIPAVDGALAALATAVPTPPAQLEAEITALAAAPQLAGRAGVATALRIRGWRLEGQCPDDAVHCECAWCGAAGPPVADALAAVVEAMGKDGGGPSASPTMRLIRLAARLDAHHHAFCCFAFRPTGVAVKKRTRDSGGSADGAVPYVSVFASAMQEGLSESAPPSPTTKTEGAAPAEFAAALDAAATSELRVLKFLQGSSGGTEDTPSFCRPAPLKAVAVPVTQRADEPPKMALSAARKDADAPAAAQSQISELLAASAGAEGDPEDAAFSRLVAAIKTAPKPASLMAPVGGPKHPPAASGPKVKTKQQSTLRPTATPFIPPPHVSVTVGPAPGFHPSAAPTQMWGPTVVLAAPPPAAAQTASPLPGRSAAAPVLATPTTEPPKAVPPVPESTEGMTLEQRRALRMARFGGGDATPAVEPAAPPKAPPPQPTGKAAKAPPAKQPPAKNSAPVIGGGKQQPQPTVAATAPSGGGAGKKKKKK